MSGHAPRRRAPVVVAALALALGVVLAFVPYFWLTHSTAFYFLPLAGLRLAVPVGFTMLMVFVVDRSDEPAPRALRLASGATWAFGLAGVFWLSAPYSEIIMLPGARDLPWLATIVGGELARRAIVGGSVAPRVFAGALYGAAIGVIAATGAAPNGLWSDPEPLVVLLEPSLTGLAWLAPAGVALLWLWLYVQGRRGCLE